MHYLHQRTLNTQDPTCSKSQLKIRNYLPRNASYLAENVISNEITYKCKKKYGLEGKSTVLCELEFIAAVALNFPFP